MDTSQLLQFYRSAFVRYMYEYTHSLLRQEESKAVKGMGADEQVRRARDITQTRILTQDEFKQVRRRQLQKLVQFDAKAQRRGGKKRKNDDDDNVNVIDIDEVAAQQR